MHLLRMIGVLCNLSVKKDTNGASSQVIVIVVYLNAWFLPCSFNEGVYRLFVVMDVYFYNLSVIVISNDNNMLITFQILHLSIGVILTRYCHT